MKSPLMDSIVVELGTFSVITPWGEPLGPRDGYWVGMSHGRLHLEDLVLGDFGKLAYCRWLEVCEIIPASGSWLGLSAPLSNTWIDFIHSCHHGPKSLWDHETKEALYPFGSVSQTSFTATQKSPVMFCGKTYEQLDSRTVYRKASHPFFPIVLLCQAFQ